jgi:hypothetical protein
VQSTGTQDCAGASVAAGFRGRLTDEIAAATGTSRSLVELTPSDADRVGMRETLWLTAKLNE